MNAEAILIISGAVVGLAQVIKGTGVPDRWGLLVAALLSAGGTVLWGWSHIGFTRELAWEYFAAFAAVFTSAAGVFGIVRASRDTVTSFTKKNHKRRD